MAARIERSEAEEAARAEQDRLFKIEEATRRECAIQRAKKMQYCETDLVKAFHSRVMLFQVLEERDSQIKLKNERKDAESFVDERYHKETLARLEADLKTEAKTDKENKLRCIEIAKDQLMQQREHVIRAQNERRIALEEGQRIAQGDREYHQKQRELERKRRENAIMYNRHLQDMRDQIKERERKECEEDEQTDRAIEAWVNRKANQTKLKKELEDKWYNDSLTMRQQLGETQFKISSNADAKVEEQIKQRMLERDLKSKKEEEEKLEKKKKNHKELRQFFHDYLRQAEERKQKKKEEDQRTLQEFLRIRDEANAQKEAQRAASLQAGKMVQSLHLKQIESNVEQRAKEKSQRLADAAARREIAEQEDQMLQNYMKQTAQEPWAIKNKRLQKFITDTTRPRPSSAAKKPGSNTTARLGFANNGYSKIELARTNEVATGDFLTMVDRSHFSTAKSVLVRGTPALSALVARMRNVWLPRQTAAIDGIQLRRNHLCVRIGRVSIGASPRGIFIQLVSVGGRHVDLHPRSQTDLDPDQTTSRIGATLDTDAESDAAALEIDSIVADLKQCVAEILPELPLAEYSHDANEQAMLHELAAQGQTGNAEVHLMIKALRFQSIL
eukprot:jgi/Hompol1/6233/HPOL_004914-RA